MPQCSLGAQGHQEKPLELKPTSGKVKYKAYTQATQVTQVNSGWLGLTSIYLGWLEITHPPWMALGDFGYSDYPSS